MENPRKRPERNNEKALKYMAAVGSFLAKNNDTVMPKNATMATLIMYILSHSSITFGINRNTPIEDITNIFIIMATLRNNETLFP